MGADPVVDNHSFLVVREETQDGLLARDAARIRSCPYCRQPLSEEHCQRLGVDHPLFAAGDAEAARAMERAMGRAEGLSLVGAAGADLFNQQRRLGMAVWVSVPQGLIPEELGGEDSPMVCELVTAPARLTAHRAVRDGTAGNLRVQLRGPAGVPGGPLLVVDWNQVSFHHVAPRIQRRAQSLPRRRGQNAQRGGISRGSSLGVGRRQGSPLQREGRAVTLGASPAPGDVSAQARPQVGSIANVVAQSPPQRSGDARPTAAQHGNPPPRVLRAQAQECEAQFPPVEGQVPIVERGGPPPREPAGPLPPAPPLCQTP